MHEPDRAALTADPGQLRALDGTSRASESRSRVPGPSVLVWVRRGRDRVAADGGARRVPDAQVIAMLPDADGVRVESID